jgi:glycosyltransferase involved in cell wall biosynthesis
MALHGWRPPRTFAARLIQRLETWAIRRADHVVAVDSRIAADQRLAFLPSEQISVIPNGYELPTAERSHAIEQEIDQLTAGSFSVVAIGRLSNEKGFDLLLEATAKLRQQGQNIAVAIFGDGEERQQLKQRIATANLQSHVRLFGYVENAASYLGLFNCLVIPSRSEGCPLIAIEGMRAGIPIVASRVGGLPRMLKHGLAGALVESDSVSELANTLTEVSRNEPSVKTRVDEASQFVCEEFCPERMAANYAELYSRLVTEFASRRHGMNNSYLP